MTDDSQAAGRDSSDRGDRRDDHDRPQQDPWHEPSREAQQEPWWAAPGSPAAAPEAAPPLAAQAQPELRPQPQSQPEPYGQGQGQPDSQPAYGQPSYGQPSYGQPAYGQPASWQSAYGSPTTAGSSPDSRKREKGPRGLPSLLLVAVIAAVVGAAVGSGFVAVGKKSSNNASNTTNDVIENPGPTANVSLPAGSVAAVAQSLLPSVVSIIVTGTDEQDEGTGIILSSDGQILTNNHVVEAAASSGVIAVTFSDGRTVTASIVGRDPTSDLAVIKAGGISGLHAAKRAQNASVVVGQQVVAVGSPLGLSNTVTSGIVSSLNRPVCTQNCGGSSDGSTPTVLDAIQTDAAINPGNSGGPLVDMAGNIIGINTAIATLDQQQNSGQSGNIGVGFAIPINEARRVVSELQSTGHASHAVIGIGVNDSIDSQLHTPNGAKIVSVTPGGPAAKAGIKIGDVLVKFGSRKVVDADSLIAATHAAVPSSTVSVTYSRGGQQSTVQVTLGSATSG